MPDFDWRFSASFISSKEGGTPSSFRRSLMKSSSSSCLRVSMADRFRCRGRNRNKPATFIQVPVWFCNCLLLVRLKIEMQDGNEVAGIGRWGAGGADNEAVGVAER